MSRLPARSASSASEARSYISARAAVRIGATLEIGITAASASASASATSTSSIACTRLNGVNVATRLLWLPFICGTSWRISELMDAALK